MLKLQTILDNYKEWETLIDDRFGRRLCNFLTPEQAEKINFILSSELAQKPWTEENVKEQLKQDVEFAWEKACNGRGISSALMVDVVSKWCKVLENGLQPGEYEDYGKEFLSKVDRLYGWGITKEDVKQEGYALEQILGGQEVKKL